MKYLPRIRELREEKKLKQKEIAKILGMEQQQYALYENGSRAIPIKHLRALCEYYNISADYILGLTNQKRSYK